MLLPIIIFVVLLGLLVFIHELGHFLAAKRIGAAVEEFGFGFPPRLFGIKRGGTIYSINWIPLGGFVKIKGELGDQSGDPQSFSSKTTGQRAFVLVAGVAMNFLLAVVLYTIGFKIGLPQTFDDSQPLPANLQSAKVVIAQVAAGSAAEEVGLKLGDQILTLDGQPIERPAEVQDYLTSHRQQVVAMQIERGSEDLTYQVQARPLDGSPAPVIGIGFVLTGIVSYGWGQSLVNGFSTTYFVAINILRSFGQIITSLLTTGGAGLDVAGPIGVAVLTSDVVRLGFIYLLNFAAILSVNLGIINILPIPALDGGRLLFVIIEKLKGRPVNQKVEGLSHNLGFILMIALLLIISFHDVARYGGRIWEGLRSFFS